jgi:hypothetical protein
MEPSGTETSPSKPSQGDGSKGMHRLVDYVLGAEFDIDLGSTLRHAYPSRVATMQDQDAFFAEHMLPEGAHKHVDDWTAFLINRESTPVSSMNLSPMPMGQPDLECFVAYSDAAEPSEQDAMPQRRWTHETTAGADTVWRVSVVATDTRVMLMLSSMNSSGELLGGESDGVVLWLPTRTEEVQLRTLNRHECSLVVLRTQPASQGLFPGDTTALQAASQRLIPDDATAMSASTTSEVAIRLCFREERFRERFEAKLERVFQTTQRPNRDHSLPSAAGGGAGAEAATAAPLVRPMYFCFNLVSNRPNLGVRRGAVVRAICIVSRYPFAHVLKPVLDLALEAYFCDCSASVLKRLYHSLNGLNLRALPGLSHVDKLLLQRQIEARPVESSSNARRAVSAKENAIVGMGSRHSSRGKGTHSRQRHVSLSVSGQRYTIRTVAQWPSSRAQETNSANELQASVTSSNESAEVATEAMSVAIDVPLFVDPDVICGASLELLLAKFGASTMRIYNAVLLEHKVLFLSSLAPAGHVSAAVLAAGSLLAPVVHGLASRCFAYANLNHLSWLEHDGYIAGVTNPVFASRESWWDVLCNLDTGVVTISNAGSRDAAEVALALAKEESDDLAFISRVIDGAQAG